MTRPAEYIGTIESLEALAPETLTASHTLPILRIVPEVIEVDNQILLAGVAYAEPGWHSVVARGARTDLARIAFQAPHDVEDEVAPISHPYHDAQSLKPHMSYLYI